MPNEFNSNYATNDQLVSNALYSLMPANQFFFENKPQEFVSRFNNSTSLDLQLYEAGGDTYSDNSCSAHLVKCEADSIYFDNSCSASLVECEAEGTYFDSAPLVDNNGSSYFADSTYSDSTSLVDNNSNSYFGFNDNISFSNDYNLDSYFSNLEIESSSDANNNASASLVDNNSALILALMIIFPSVMIKILMKDTNNEYRQDDNESESALLELKLNITQPKTMAVVKINLFDNTYNHSLTSMIDKISLWYHKFMPEILFDIEKYVVKDRIDSGSIFSLLQYDYPNYLLNKCDIYNAVYNFRQKNNP
ncbi:15077_t:CDS:2, partial [Racocetra persica]